MAPSDQNGGDPHDSLLPISNPFGEQFCAPELSRGEYHVLDEADGQGDECDASYSDFDSDLDQDELLDMLEADLPESFKGTRPVKSRQCASAGRGDPSADQLQEYDKVVLIEKGRKPVEPLPEGWVQATHCSGMPVYLHRTTRVATVSRPYFLGPGSIRKHDIPLHSVPCLQYMKTLEKERSAEDTTESDKVPDKSIQAIGPNSVDAGDSSHKREDREEKEVSSNGAVIPDAEAEDSGGRAAGNDIGEEEAGSTSVSNTAGDEHCHANVDGQDPSISGCELQDYCRRRFHFRTLKLIKFDSWKERRQHGRMVKAQRPQLSDKTKLLCFPMKAGESCTSERDREWVLNPDRKTWVCIFHEYLQRVLREQPVYTYNELENSVTPYSATASVAGIQYGTGVGSSKKQAKLEAAKASLQILIPAQMSRIVEQGEKVGGVQKESSKSQKPAAMIIPVQEGPGATLSSTTSTSDTAIDLSFFDSIRLEDPRVADLCRKAAEPSPFTILILCLQRNFGLSGSEVSCRLINSKHQRNQFEMSVGKHQAVANCKNKKDGKQLAAQSLLQQLHPQLTSWGSMLRMYGNYSSSSLKAKRQEERDITALQRRGSVHAPNMAILNKLRTEMLKLSASRAQAQPIGTIQLGDLEETTESAVALDMVEL